MTPAFYKQDKLPKFYKQWTSRLKLEIIKMKHSLIAADATPQQKRQMKEEIENFINKAYEIDQEAQLEDVYVTNHEPRQKKFLTASSQEDEQFYRYK
jgi:spore germination cell wall hydrolase CwlJ-like protein